jgi:hypothetical protein
MEAKFEMAKLKIKTTESSGMVDDIKISNCKFYCLASVQNLINVFEINLKGLKEGLRC